MASLTIRLRISPLSSIPRIKQQGFLMVETILCGCTKNAASSMLTLGMRKYCDLVSCHQLLVDGGPSQLFARVGLSEFLWYAGMTIGHGKKYILDWSEQWPMPISGTARVTYVWARIRQKDVINVAHVLLRRSGRRWLI